jgi:hypothetical protein
MQKFTLLHDGSDQGWQATYLALHIAARLGAPLQVLHMDLGNDTGTLNQRVAQVEISGHAAGVIIETGFLPDLSMDTLGKIVAARDGFFLPRRLISDGDIVSQFLDAYSCPLWIASQEPEIHRMAVLVNDPAEDTQLIEFTRSLSNRLGQSLTGLIQEEKYKSGLMHGSPDLKWLALPEISPGAITSVLERLDADLLVLSAANVHLAGNLPCNCIICPAIRNA